MAYKQKDSINNMLNVPFHQRNALIEKQQNTKNTMATIPGAGETRVVGGSGFIGYLGGGATKLGMKVLAKNSNLPAKLKPRKSNIEIGIGKIPKKEYISNIYTK